MRDFLTNWSFDFDWMSFWIGALLGTLAQIVLEYWDWGNKK